ncbi:MAG TPA: hypothetical protein VF399_07385 [bacterium]
MVESSVVKHFWSFLNRYFKETEIIHHHPFTIIVNNDKRTVKPDFYINGNQRLLFEFKELKESDDPNSHLGRRLDFINKSTEEPTSQFVRSISPYIKNKIFEAADQLKPAEELKCPAVLVVHSGVPGICCEFNDGTFMEAMYHPARKDESARTPAEIFPYISAVANFRCDTNNVYHIKFYHNYYATCKLPSDALDGSECEHYDDFEGWIEDSD